MKTESLNTLARIQRWDLDRLRREMNELQKLRDDLIRRDEKLVHILSREAELAEEGKGEADYALFAQRIGEQRDSLAVSVAEVDRNIDVKQIEVSEVFQEIKRYEIVEKRVLQRQQREEERRDQARLDEIGLNTHIRQRGGGR